MADSRSSEKVLLVILFLLSLLFMGVATAVSDDGPADCNDFLERCDP